MKTDLRYCMSSYLQYRTVVDKECRFADHITPWYFTEPDHRTPVNTAQELERQLRLQVEKTLAQGPAALMLSSGMDSAILAGLLPEGTQTYTLRCLADAGIDETAAARAYAEKNHLRHDVIDITWQDFEGYALPLMKQKGYPIHSIEVQIYKAALRAKGDGIGTLIFGETADIIYGGHSKLLARDWTEAEFLKRFSFVDPTLVMKDPMVLTDPITPYVGKDGNVDVPAFLNGFEYGVSLGFYTNACRLGGVNLSAPYSHTILDGPLDMTRIRSGEGKYIIRELYQKLYPDMPVPDKTPLPRPMAQWLRDWEGPQHPAFYRDNIAGMSGDQKWYVYALDEFMRHVAEG